MSTIEHFNIDEISNTQISTLSNSLSWSDLWWEDLEEAGIEDVYVCFEGNQAVGFQTVSIDNECVAIEVHPDFQGQGITRLLIEESNCTKPERNENPQNFGHM